MSAASRRRKRFVVIAIGGVGLAVALTVSAFVAPERSAREIPTYTPTTASHVVVTVPPRNPDEVAARQALAADPDRIEIAVALARADIQRYRKESDPRYLGHAQATLARWWKLPEPPPEVLLVRATILQSVHEFAAARVDLDRLIALRPDDLQAHLTHAVVARVTGDYATARASCAVVARLTEPLIAATCMAPLDGIAGKLDEAYTRLDGAPSDGGRGDPAVRGSALTALAELAIQRGDAVAAISQLRGALAIDTGDAYARALLADVLLAAGEAAEVSTLLAGRESVDSLLLRRAIAEHRLRGKDAERLATVIRGRIVAAAARGDRIHLREAARFTLVIEGDAAKATALARDNWVIQKELADARLLADAAAAAGDRAAATPVIEWARATGVKDVQLERALAMLPAPASTP